MRTELTPLWTVVAVVFFNAGAALAETRLYKLPEEAVDFQPGPGVEAAQNNCLSCHSADYVNTQPPRLGETFWKAEVSKMIKAYRAPISEADAKAVIDYLSKAY